MQPSNVQVFAQQTIRLFVDAQPWLIPASFFFVAFVVMLLIGNPLIEWLRNKQWKKGAAVEETWAVREDTPDTHQAKKGTPSMGGIGIISATLLSLISVPLLGVVMGAVAWPGIPLLTVFARSGMMRLSPITAEVVLGFCLLPLVFLLHGALGFADDWSKASGRGGLRARAKLAGQIFLSLVFVALFVITTQTPTPNNLEYFFSRLSTMNSAFFVFAVGLCAFVVIATSNAVNLADGIDGLVSGLAVQCGLTLIFVGLGRDGLPLLWMWTWAALAGACLGFLNFNRYKASVFMGDTGSLAIGAALGAGAILQGAVFLLPFIGFIYFVEMFSVVVQVLWFKYTKAKTGEGKRLFRRAPLHHHFELGGWSEWRVVLTFWAVNLLTSAIGLVLWHLGIIPRWP